MAKTETDIKKKKKSSGSFSHFMMMTFCCFSAVLVICFTSYTTLKYWVEIYSKYKENKELNMRLAQLKKKEEALRVDIDKMQDSDYIARYAREKYLYSKEWQLILNIK